MLVLVLMIAGFGLIAGGKEFAGKAATGVVGAALILSALPCALQSCEGLFLPPNDGWLPSLSGGFLAVAALSAVTVLGFIAWRRRAERAKSRELWQRRNGNSRGRALAAPPRAHDGGEG